MLGGGCGSEPLDGSLRIVGSSNLLPMMSQLAGTFTADNPLVRLDLRMNKRKQQRKPWWFPKRRACDRDAFGVKASFLSHQA